MSMEQTFVSKVFWWVARLLQNIAKVTHLTYNEINIIVYYFLIPLTWCIMIDVILQVSLFTIIWIALWIMIFFFVRNNFSLWCDKIFTLSQRFIRFFGEYVKYSVIICVIIPLIIYVILIMKLLQ